MVLVVDDEKSIRELLTELLTSGGYAVREAASGIDAMRIADSERPAAVLLDVRLPGMSGYDVCRQLRDRFGEQLPIMFLSGERTESFDRVAGLRLGGDDYIVKPFDPDELLARIDRMTGRDESATTADTQYRLTKREIEVLGLLANGSSGGEIAVALSISRKTVGTHIQSILGKLDVHTQAQAVSVAFRDGLVEVPTG